MTRLRWIERACVSVASLALLAGCAANGSGGGGGRGNTSREVALLIPASADATATMGVVAWQVYSLGQRTRVVGVDATNRTLGEVQASPRTNRTTGERVIDVETIVPVRALLRFTAQGQVLENTLTNDEEASAWMVVAHHELGQALPADGTTYYASCGWSAAGAGFRCLGAGAACGGAAIACGSGWLTWACGLGGAGCVAAGGMCG
ncbi:MAG: hypothetical protein IT379_01075, partial [Deltaproteobacteria bacterium]|nr:hypothetical protein [Deltaproteobacteria bacterium]